MTKIKQDIISVLLDTKTSIIEIADEVKKIIKGDYPEETKKIARESLENLRKEYKSTNEEILKAKKELTEGL